MAAPGAVVQADVMEELAERPSIPTRLGRFIRKQPLGTAGLLIVLVMIIAAIFAHISSALRVGACMCRLFV